MTLYILRHALAVSRDTWIEDDSERPLTLKGTQIMRRLAKIWHDIVLPFDLILSSPYRRAEQTADIVAAAFKMKPKIKLTDHLTPDGDPEKLVNLVIRLAPRTENILLVGHEPYLSQLVSVLVTGSSDLSLTLKKAGLVKLSANSLRYGRCATLEWLLEPRVFLDARD